ncbi:hypothetical protein PIB30_041224 [Stylosanthes scabra]|uniref:Uncharacterized protein n=1 Tax=Stylosanthes scabra TaxID=79078 RepID=A0ABU6REY9_9FABA|nr:hypothetical protein [Stylosanthes scabra]
MPVGRRSACSPSRCLPPVGSVSEVCESVPLGIVIAVEEDVGALADIHEGRVDPMDMQAGSSVTHSWVLRSTP